MENVNLQHKSTPLISCRDKAYENCDLKHNRVLHCAWNISPQELDLEALEIS